MQNNTNSPLLFDEEKWDEEMSKDSKLLDLLGEESINEVSEEDYKDEEW